MNFWIICIAVKILNKLKVDLDGVHAKIKNTIELQTQYDFEVFYD